MGRTEENWRYSHTHIYTLYKKYSVCSLKILSALAHLFVRRLFHTFLKLFGHGTHIRFGSFFLLNFIFRFQSVVRGWVCVWRFKSGIFGCWYTPNQAIGFFYPLIATRWNSMLLLLLLSSLLYMRCHWETYMMYDQQSVFLYSPYFRTISSNVINWLNIFAFTNGNPSRRLIEMACSFSMVMQYS